MQNQLVPEKTSATPALNEYKPIDQDEAFIKRFLGDAKRKIRQRNHNFLKRMLVCFSMVLLGVVPIFLFLPLANKYMLAWLIYICALVATASVIMFSHSMLPFPFDIGELHQRCGVKAIGPLIDSLCVNLNYKDYEPLYSALTPLLLQLNASDSSLISKSQYHILYRILGGELERPRRRNRENLAFKLAILKALEQVGAETFLPVVERLANFEARSVRQRQIQVAAQECLPYLIANAGLITSQRTLLRASTAQQISPDTLLRPAEQGSETPADQLLRPTDIA